MIGKRWLRVFLHRMTLDDLNIFAKVFATAAEMI